MNNIRLREKKKQTKQKETILTLLLSNQNEMDK